MSHFTVLVIGDDVEGQLAPYSENIVAEPRREYMTRAEVREFRESMQAEGEDVGTLAKLARFIEGYTGKPGGLAGRRLYTETTYNADSKWDWWCVGGRWSGFFRLKPGIKGEVGTPGVFGNAPKKGYADVVRKRDVDWDGMRDDARKQANADYDRWERVVAGRTVPTWDSVRKRYADGDIEKARDEYHSHPVIAEIQKEFGFILNDPAEMFGCGRQKYVERSVNRCFETYAVVKDGRWYEKGKMGWFGMSIDEKDEHVWNQEFQSLLDNLPDDTLLTLVDCHI